MEELILNIKKITADKILKIVISNKVEKQYKYNKIIILLKEKNDSEYYQIERYTDKQVFHENISKEVLNDKLLEIISGNYKQVNGWSQHYTYDLKISKKGKVNLKRNKGDNRAVEKKSHNNEKNYILKEGTIIQPLIDLGVFTKEGKVVRSMYDKYKQINRFVEIIDDEIKDKNCTELTILDFGCGKSYLTFVIYYYFTKIRNIRVKMIGLDLKEDVISKCNKIAESYNYDNLHFELGDINGFKYNDKVDMVITLHACDTATDYALFNAIKWNVKNIFSVPCCQHELNSQMESKNLSIVTKYGIIKERIGALLTDSIRGSLLECAGYKTQILEFIDIEHSPKNILIRAEKCNISKQKRNKALKEVENIMEEFNVKPTLYKLLKENSYLD